MAVNKYKDHVWVLSEDSKTREIANGFVLHPSINERCIDIRPFSGGWPKVLTERVRQVCWSCGIKAIVVRVPASKPTSVTISIGEVSAKVTGLTQEGGYPQRRIHPDSLS